MRSPSCVDGVAFHSCAKSAALGCSPSNCAKIPNASCVPGVSRPSARFNSLRWSGCWMSVSNFFRLGSNEAPFR